MTIDTQLFYLLNNLAGQSPLFDAVIVFLASYLAYILVTLFLVFLFFSQYQKREKLQIFWVTVISTALRGSALSNSFVFSTIARGLSRRFPSINCLPTMRGRFLPGMQHSSSRWRQQSISTIKNGAYFFFLATTLITVSRVIAGIHYPSDIVGGALIGIAVAYSTLYVTRKIY